MKKHRFLHVIIILITILGFTACKKEDNRDLTILFKNTVWTGEFNYTGYATQTASMDFKENGEVRWYEMTKDYGGTWAVADGKLKVTFGNNTGFEARITKDNKLKNIQNLSINGWSLTSGELNTTPDPVLDNTIWKTPGLNLSFKPGGIVFMDNGNGTTWILSYTRKPKSLSFFSGTWNMFTIFSSSTVMKGSNKLNNEPEVHPFQVTKE